MNFVLDHDEIGPRSQGFYFSGVFFVKLSIMRKMTKVDREIVQEGRKR
jgi:hypothetical protein